MRLQAVRPSRLSLDFVLITTLLLMPAVLSAQEKIAFQSRRDGNPEVYVMNPDGTNQRRLTFNSLFDGEPAFTPSGEKIAFSSYRDGNSDIYIIFDATITPSSHAIVAGGTITLFLNYTDQGYHGSPGDENLRAFIQWGDGQGVGIVTGQPVAVNLPHQYTAAGNYSIIIEVSDNDGGLTTAICDVVVSAPPPPAAPTNFQILSVAANQIQLAWTDASTTEDGYAIERCTGHGCNNFAEIGRVGPNTTTYLDGPVVSNTQYSYRMRAFNTGGVSPYTNVVSAKTPRR